jgi:hypothetical protein
MSRLARGLATTLEIRARHARRSIAPTPIDGCSNKNRAGDERKHRRADTEAGERHVDSCIATYAVGTNASRHPRSVPDRHPNELQPTTLVSANATRIAPLLR